MKLNIILFFAIMAAYAAPVFSQDEGKASQQNEQVNTALKAQFSKDVTAYFKAFNNRDWQAVTDMIYPKLFDLVTKEQLTATLDQMETMGMNMTIDIIAIDNISAAVQQKGSTYYRVYYDGKITIQLSGDMLSSKDQLQQNFESLYGASNVSYDDGTTTFKIMANNSVIAIKKEKQKDWKYIEFNQQQEALLRELLTEEVFAKLID
ncbi:hypothetical protein [Aquimarina brevivitae]|uniref:DUF4468 domain-containing protein n=1 Tax=Aquimarina brevivitae TaxID=323412 RepID=A0A4Q7PGT9_9FLAO|nr:hypothetical protein [Aquimarina brevivitae]RZS99128.1 hypothetical protein EV197_0333 [Aquimarina brevivitae]